jgi:hydrogenase nickel incorporation protein HypB
MCAHCGCGTEHEHHAHDHHDNHDHHHHHEHQDHGHGNGHPHAHHRTITLEERILAKNDAAAARNRAYFAAQGICALNLTSAPGAGKTTLLEKLIDRLAGRLRLSVIEGDQETERDAERIRATGCPVRQINTGRGCHLDAEMIGGAIRTLAPPPRSVLFIENVGNLVCPALFDLGERAKVVVMSVTEGEDKPLKYPHMFRAARALVLSKTDLLPHLEVDVERCLTNAHRVNPHLRVFPVSARRGDGLDDLCTWIGGESLAAAG